MSFDALQTEIENMSDELDPGDVMDTLFEIADTLDLDLGRVIAKMKHNPSMLEGYEVLISTIISSTQSNLQHSLFCIQRAWYANILFQKG